MSKENESAGIMPPMSAFKLSCFKYDLSTVTICEKLTTDVTGNLESAFSKSKFAGELA